MRNMNSEKQFLIENYYITLFISIIERIFLIEVA